MTAINLPEAEIPFHWVFLRDAAAVLRHHGYQTYAGRVEEAITALSAITADRQEREDWVSVPRIGARVRADHPQTCLNPEPTFEVVEVRADDHGSGFAVRGKNTCWFGVGMVRPAAARQDHADAAGFVTWDLPKQGEQSDEAQSTMGGE